MVKKNHDHGGFAAGQVAKRSPGDGLHVCAADLGERQRFADLCGKIEAASLCDLSGEADVEWLFAARAHALRVGEDPPALFASMIRRGLKLFPSLEDQVQGHKQKKEWLGW